MNVIEKVLKAVAACPNCQCCPYEDFSTRYCGNRNERNCLETLEGKSDD